MSPNGTACASKPATPTPVRHRGKPAAVGQAGRVNPYPNTFPRCHHRPVGCTVLVVDDHAEFRSVVRALLQAEGFDVVGEAADAQAALDSVIRLRPEVVLLDVLLPGLDGFVVADLLA